MDKTRIGKDRYGPLRKFIWRAQTDLTLDQIFTEDPYPIKGMWIQTCNPLAGIGMDPKKWLDALQEAGLRRRRRPVPYPHHPVRRRRPARRDLPGEGRRAHLVGADAEHQQGHHRCRECRPDVEINFELAKRFDPDFRWETIHDLFDEIVKPVRADLRAAAGAGLGLSAGGAPQRAPTTATSRACCGRTASPASRRPPARSSCTPCCARSGGWTRCPTTRSRPSPRSASPSC